MDYEEVCRLVGNLVLENHVKVSNLLKQVASLREEIANKDNIIRVLQDEKSKD